MRSSIIALHTLVIGSSWEAFRVNECSLDVHQLVVDDPEHVYPLIDALFLPQLLYLRLEQLHSPIKLVRTAGEQIYGVGEEARRAFKTAIIHT